MRRIMVLILAAGIIVTVAERSALGCSCVAGDDPRTDLARSDGAFVGSLISRQEPTPDSNGTITGTQEVAYRFHVDHAVKGKFGSTVDVYSAASGASCGLEGEPGRRIGLFLDRKDGRWKSSLCQQVDPEALLRAARPLPRPNGDPPARLLIGGSLGDVRVVSTDLRGRTVAYGRGTPATEEISVCPGGKRIVEVVGRSLEQEPYTEWRVAVRDVDGLRLVREVVLRSLSKAQGPAVEAVSCRDPDANEVLVFAAQDVVSRPVVEPPRSGPLGRVIRIRGRSESTLYGGTWRAAAFGTGFAFMIGGPKLHDLIRLDLTNGRTRTILHLPFADGVSGRGIVLSPDGSMLALFDDAWHPKLYVVALSPTPTLLASRDTGAWPTPIWWGNDRILAAGQEGLVVLDTKLHQKGTVRGWDSYGTVVIGDQVFGIRFGDLVSVSLPSGRIRTLSRFYSESLAVLSALPVPAARPRPSPTHSSRPTETPQPAATTPPPIAEPRIRPAPRAAKGVPGGVASILVALTGAAWFFGRRRVRAR